MEVIISDFKSYIEPGAGAVLMLTVPSLPDQGELAKIQELLANGKPIKAEIKQHRQRRSLDANAYAWVLIGKQAELLSLSPLEVYQKHIREVGIYRDVEVDVKAEKTIIHIWELHGLGWLSERLDNGKEGFVVVRLYYGSSTYNAKQMARLIDSIVTDCKELGIETMTPEQLDGLKEAWGR